MTLSTIEFAVMTTVPPATVESVPFCRVPPFRSKVEAFIVNVPPLTKVPPDNVKSPAIVESVPRVKVPPVKVKDPPAAIEIVFALAPAEIVISNTPIVTSSNMSGISISQLAASFQLTPSPNPVHTILPPALASTRSTKLAPYVTGVSNAGSMFSEINVFTSVPPPTTSMTRTPESGAPPNKVTFRVPSIFAAPTVGLLMTS